MRGRRFFVVLGLVLPSFDEGRDFSFEFGKGLRKKIAVLVDQILLENVSIARPLAMPESTQFIELFVRILRDDRFSLVGLFRGLSQ